MADNPDEIRTGDPVLDKLMNFTRAYHVALEAALTATGRQKFPHHGEPTGLIATIRASDGFVTFYMPSAPDPDVFDGHYLFDYSEHDLNTVCQSLHVHRLKIVPPRIGEPWDDLQIDVPDTDPIPDFSAPWINLDVAQLVKDREIQSLQGVTHSPVVHFENGVRKYVAPGRLSIWSPVFDYPEIGARRLYMWTHADFWWHPEKLDLDPDRAPEVAENEILALHTVLSGISAFTPDVANRDIFYSAADKLERQCEEFVELLDTHGHDEEVLHQWLKKQENHIFLDGDPAEVRSKVAFGDHVSDFVVKRSDNTYKLVEIEPASERIFTKKGAKPSQRFNHACQQVHDWQDYIREHVHHVREVQRLVDIYQPKGMVLMGRSVDINSEAAMKRWRNMKSEHRLEVATYDEACDRVRNLAKHLRHLTEFKD